MIYLIDTDWLINIFNNRIAYAQQLDRFAPRGLAVSIITLAELYEGVDLARDPQKTLAAIQALPERSTILGIDDATAQRFASIRSRLRRQGNLIPDLDLLIACTALCHGLTLCSQNVKHFSRISELQLFSL